MKLSEIIKFDPDFEMLDGFDPVKPYSCAEVMKAMRQLHARIERQADNYGGDTSKVDKKTGKVDTSKHKFFPAQIAKDIK
jgi:hypothetical protein